jgi:hypothetical protein
MREKLNGNPMAQVGLIVVLLAAAAFMLLGKSGGGEEGEEASEGAVATVNGVTATGATPGEAVEGAVESLEEGAGSVGVPGELPASIPVRPPPEQLTAAYEAGRTVVLLIIHDGRIDRSLTRAATAYVADAPETALFVVPVQKLARYAAVTVGVDLNRVPALVVMRPRKLSRGIPQATVAYGFQTPQTVIQAVRDAAYNGPEISYHPN